MPEAAVWTVKLPTIIAITDYQRQPTRQIWETLSSTHATTVPVISRDRRLPRQAHTVSLTIDHRPTDDRWQSSPSVSARYPFQSNIHDRQITAPKISSRDAKKPPAVTPIKPYLSRVVAYTQTDLAIHCSNDRKRTTQALH